MEEGKSRLLPRGDEFTLPLSAKVELLRLVVTSLLTPSHKIAGQDLESWFRTTAKRAYEFFLEELIHSRLRVEPHRLSAAWFSARFGKEFCSWLAGVGRKTFEERGMLW